MAYAGRLYDHMVGRFGESQVFMDIDTLEPGVDFVEHIERAVGSSAVLLVVIGRQWLADEGGRSRFDDPNDFVRLEVAAGLEHGVRVIPVLVQGAEIPRADDLPEELAPLARRNAFDMSDTRWRRDVERLTAAIEKGSPARRPTPQFWSRAQRGLQRSPPDLPQRSGRSRSRRSTRSRAPTPRRRRPASEWTSGASPSHAGQGGPSQSGSRLRLRWPSLLAWGALWSIDRRGGQSTASQSKRRRDTLL